MSSSAITTQTAQLKIGNVQNQADSTSVYSAGVWSFKNSTALTSVTITDAGNVGIGTASPVGRLDVASDTSPIITIRNTAQKNWNTNDTIGYLDYRIDDSSSAGARTVAYVRSLVDTGVSNGVTVASNLVFGTGAYDGIATERMRIDASGNLLVGTTNSSLTTGTGFKVIGASNSYIGVVTDQSNNSNAGIHLYSTSAGAYRFYVGNGGTIFATSTSITAISDASLKENIRDLETGLSQVLALKPRRFDWKEETQIDQKDVAGFIAQEVEEVLPELVYEYKYNEDETKKSIKMGDMLPTLVKAIQEQQAMIESMKAEIEALKAK